MVQESCSVLNHPQLNAGTTHSACYNANAPFVMKPFLELQEADLKPGIDLYYYGALNFSQAVIPWMLSNKSSQGGTIIFSGATASMKGSAKFAAFAPAKFALRAMSERGNAGRVGHQR